MTEITLAPNEIILMRASNVKIGGVFSAYNDELVLTTQNLLIIDKGFTGRIKSIEPIPLSAIGTHNHVAQAFVGKLSNGLSCLEIYIDGNRRTFEFQTESKRRYEKWVRKINEAMLGTAQPDSEESVLDTITDTIGTLASSFLGFGSGNANKTTTTQSGRCKGCHAPLVAQPGVQVTCEYCDTPQTLG